MNVAGMLHANTKRARESSRLGQDSSKLNVYPMRRCVTPDVETLKNRVLAEQEKNALLQEANEELRRRCAHLTVMLDSAEKRVEMLEGTVEVQKAHILGLEETVKDVKAQATHYRNANAHEQTRRSLLSKQLYEVQKQLTP
jgi:chromosome segregation ATPase